MTPFDAVLARARAFYRWGADGRKLTGVMVETLVDYTAPSEGDRASFALGRRHHAEFPPAFINQPIPRTGFWCIPPRKP